MAKFSVTYQVGPDIPSRLQAAIEALKGGALRAGPIMARVFQDKLHQFAPVRRGRLRRSIRVRFTGARIRGGVRLTFSEDAIFYAAPVNARSRYVEQAFRVARPLMFAILVREMRAALARIAV